MQADKNRIKLQKLTMTALMAAIIFVVTYIVRIPLPFASGGYLNIGDVPVYLGAYLLGGPAGAIAALIGSALSDLASGYVFYMLPTAVIKGVMGLVCGVLLVRGDSLRRFIFTSVLGGAIMVAGYAGFELFFFNINQAIAGLPFNAVQWAAGVIVASLLYRPIKNARTAIPALKQTKIEKRS